MNTHISRISLLAIGIMISSFSYSQYKYDLGLKISSFDRNALQVEFRTAITPSFSLFTNLNYGGKSDGYGYINDPSGDTLADQFNSSRRLTSYTGIVGFRKAIHSLPGDFFYAGAALGVGYEEYVERDTRLKMYLDENGESIHVPTGETVTVESSTSQLFDYGMFYGLYLNIGMDIPLGKRFSVNCELNAITYYSETESGFGFAPRFSGGLIYSFGKISE
ncbi:MAG: hypothetical protein AB8B56_07620 [Crocinitomicaceae bacterium]